DAAKAFDVVAEAVAHRIANANRRWDIHKGAEKIGDYEPGQRQADHAGQRAGQKAKSGQEAPDKHPPWAVSRDETAHGLEPRRRRHEPTTVALQPSEPVSPTDPVAEVIASGGTDNPDGQNQGKPQGPSPHQVAGQEENCFLWDWDTDVADHYEQKDRSV